MPDYLGLEDLRLHSGIHQTSGREYIIKKQVGTGDLPSDHLIENCGLYFWQNTQVPAAWNVGNNVRIVYCNTVTYHPTESPTTCNWGGFVLEPISDAEGYGSLATLFNDITAGATMGRSYFLMEQLDGHEWNGAVIRGADIYLVNIPHLCAHGTSVQLVDCRLIKLVTETPEAFDVLYG